jgi:hypothetical protein
VGDKTHTVRSAGLEAESGAWDLSNKSIDYPSVTLVLEKAIRGNVQK